VGLLVIGIFQTLLVTRILTMEQQIPIVIPANGAIGIWLLLTSSLALRGKVFPLRLIWAGLIAGVGFLLIGVGYLVGGQQSPVLVVGFVAALSYPLYQILLGRWLLHRGAPRKDTSPAE
jgi:hypothetical protein